MQLVLNNIKQPLAELSGRSSVINEEELVKNLALKKLKLNHKDIRKLYIQKKSVDARKKDSVSIVYTLLVDLEADIDTTKLIKLENVSAVEVEKKEAIAYGNKEIINQPIIIGSGPAGLFAGLVLAENGYKPLILERGLDVEKRTKAVEAFFAAGSFDAETNIQFGEGGAGTFSDGKLTTRIKDERCDTVLSKLVEAGAPAEIEYLSKPHIGTDILKEVVKNIRNRIMKLGGDVRFLSKVTDLRVEHGEVKSVIINGKEEIASNVIITALGHSARDTYTMLHNKGAAMLQKPFSIGVRVEHLQSFIDEAQYGSYAGHPLLGAADYMLSCKSSKTGRTAYSFCMCPGGMVVAAASEENMLVTNGMSEYKRNRTNANSALVVSVVPEDFEGSHPLAGVEYQRRWEAAAYRAGSTGGTNSGRYFAPIQLTRDFLKERPSKSLGKVKPSYEPGVNCTDLRSCLPKYVTDTLGEALLDFNRKIKGFGDDDSILTGVETRTSAPLRIVRNEDFESMSLKNLYPAGEGAGYAGGIISAAVDGIKVAEKIMQRFKPLG